ncbi:chymotrypsin-2 [Solenopsis invicta]|uniref:chymotrypsin-2 n=1 Tax=Solenopsis invicta TaxID=13686 RepID=UPI000595D45F|nr:chymotrypsin-2 [Solenopsis invicta]XP_011166746.1 chymotrypsin-2 [Solenopsis invicta]XP_011166747.1 chymotrypsin-2 [Solenopsis invicta]XP_011166748.1 chymotrypsin-2 [Solenopsis invicta]XP_011166749.1 chymotrypsin-2 [Solenopsis invicta]XP_039301747.1 chymotrypsin-2 [Solenopsis invicta]
MITQLLFLIPLFFIAHGEQSHGKSITLPRVTPKIVGGNVAILGEIPYQVSLQIIKTEYHFCGGSIINRLYVLTAAHCMEGLNSKDISVNVGVIDLRKPHAVYLIESSYVHKGYNPRNSFVHDIALIKVKTPFVFSSLVRPVTLPEQNQIIHAGSYAIVSGFGRLSSGGRRSNLLYTANLLITNQSYCKKVYEPLKLYVHDTQICANEPSAVKGSCQGDSGGPLTVNGTLTGIVSWARGCGDPNYPTVYTRVPSYIDWINEHIK